MDEHNIHDDLDFLLASIGHDDKEALAAWHRIDDYIRPKTPVEWTEIPKSSEETIDALFGKFVDDFVASQKPIPADVAAILAKVDWFDLYSSEEPVNCQEIVQKDVGYNLFDPPVPTESIKRLSELLLIPEKLNAFNQLYQNGIQMTDAEIVAILEKPQPFEEGYKPEGHDDVDWFGQ
jgi:hypothetical protein